MSVSIFLHKEQQQSIRREFSQQTLSLLLRLSCLPSLAGRSATEEKNPETVIVVGSHLNNMEANYLIFLRKFYITILCPVGRFISHLLDTTGTRVKHQSKGILCFMRRWLSLFKHHPVWRQSSNDFDFVSRKYFFGSGSLEEIQFFVVYFLVERLNILEF